MIKYLGSDVRKYKYQKRTSQVCCYSYDPTTTQGQQTCGSFTEVILERQPVSEEEDGRSPFPTEWSTNA